MSQPSLWDQHNVTDLIRQILRAVSPEPRYGTGRPFKTTYQIAIDFSRRFPQVAQALGHATGGEGQGPYGLTTYIARWLPDQIRNHGATDIEFRFLSCDDMRRLEFQSTSGPLVATTHQAGFDATMFRIVDEGHRETG